MDVRRDHFHADRGVVHEDIDAAKPFAHLGDRLTQRTESVTSQWTG
jgi:hypothetical protein